MPGPERAKRRNPRLLSLVLGFVTLPFVFTSTALTTFDAEILRAAGVAFSGVAIAAASCNVLTLGFIITAVVYRSQKGIELYIYSSRRRWLSLAFSILSAVTTAAAIVLTIAELSLKANHEEARATTRPRLSMGFLMAEFVIAGLSAILQVIFYCTTLLQREDAVYTQQESVPGSTEICTQPTRNDHTRSVSLSILPAPRILDAGVPSPTFSISSRASLLSLRSSVQSLQHVIRPTDSRTKLLRNGAAGSHDSLHSLSQRVSASVESIAQTNGFDTWDTSSVDPQARDTVLQSVPRRGRTLEPIPGSRPASPAHPLDGPFPNADCTDKSPERPGTSTSSIEQLRKLRSPPSHNSLNNIHPTSRPTSPEEAHIHPLFRSDSPAPPSTTPGTVITASPFSGHAIPGRSFSRARSRAGSRNGSPPRGFVRQSQSLDDLRQPLQRPPAISPDMPRSMTPPIPEFVLAASVERSPSRKRSEKSPGSAS
ncbi:hypothetical protein K402DRAFT_400845 [Aulographum hederae CBS 113979]|uniref:Uncharacterized protein n=1 Tax=Aulographum hederae CBS 113979 TaxID=1176131 RepID=A0A6G1HC88_9PEZI|nr:hypothetical protein K402DRAFT_400845 [Aulographum hederae CBS 113979]